MNLDNDDKQILTYVWVVQLLHNFYLAEKLQKIN